MYMASPIVLLRSYRRPQMVRPSTMAEAYRLVGVETAASSTLSSQTLADAPPAFADETNLYSPPLKKVKLDQGILNSSPRSPLSEISEFADQENFEATYSSLMPFATSPLYCDPPSSPSSLLEVIPSSILADIDLDSRLSAAEKLASGKSGPIIGNENINTNTPMAPMNVDGPPGFAELADRESILWVLSRSNATGGKR